MIKEGIEFKIKTVSEEKVYTHLNECSNDFIPPLSERVNIKEYARKIVDKSITFEAWKDTILVGLIAIYFDKNTDSSPFITNVSILKKFVNFGIASDLLINCIEYAKNKKYKQIILEVNQHNIPAINFYKKFNFRFDDKRGDSLVMKLQIGDKNNLQNRSY